METFLTLSALNGKPKFTVMLLIGPTPTRNSFQIYKDSCKHVYGVFRGYVLSQVLQMSHFMIHSTS